MSDLMLLGILRMPENLIEGDALSLMQFVQAARGAADRIESDAKIIDKLRAELEAAAADKRDASVYRWMRAQHWISIFEEETAIHCMDQKERLQDALAQRQGEGS